MVGTSRQNKPNMETYYPGKSWCGSVAALPLDYPGNMVLQDTTRLYMEEHDWTRMLPILQWGGTRSSCTRHTTLILYIVYINIYIYFKSYIREGCACSPKVVTPVFCRVLSVFSRRKLLTRRQSYDTIYYYLFEWSDFTTIILLDFRYRTWCTHDTRTQSKRRLRWIH